MVKLLYRGERYLFLITDCYTIEEFLLLKWENDSHRVYILVLGVAMMIIVIPCMIMCHVTSTYDA